MRFQFTDCYTLEDAAVDALLPPGGRESAVDAGNAVVDRWFRFLECECVEVPPLLRFDLLVASANGAVSVRTCEITEVGGSLSGLPVCLRSRAIVNSCFSVLCFAAFETESRRADEKQLCIF